MRTSSPLPPVANTSTRKQQRKPSRPSRRRGAKSARSASCQRTLKSGWWEPNRFPPPVEVLSALFGAYLCCAPTGLLAESRSVLLENLGVGGQCAIDNRHWLNLAAGSRNSERHINHRAGRGGNVLHDYGFALF